MTTLAAPNTTFQRNDTPAHIAGLSLVNLAARQRMLSQRMILQTVLAAQGDVTRLQAARAGQHGREFAVVANVLSDITSEIDRLTRKAAVLAERSRSTG
ncbi:MAG: hypothetical protein C4535_03490 [Comamonadaceae bacterium]|nr:MAG: hypothetical protein C4535_03490 [Comamonadaceae bacterium]